MAQDCVRRDVTMMEWISVYTDGTKLHQFDENRKENLFKDIDQDKLEIFTILDDKSQVSVNLTNGTFDLNNNIIEINGLSYREEEYRLIYFRRVTVDIGTRTVDQNKQVKSFIGYQVTINNKNHKIMFSEADNKISLHIE